MYNKKPCMLGFQNFGTLPKVSGPGPCSTVRNSSLPYELLCQTCRSGVNGVCVGTISETFRALIQTVLACGPVASKSQSLIVVESDRDPSGS